MQSPRIFLLVARIISSEVPIKTRLCSSPQEQQPVPGRPSRLEISRQLGTMRLPGCEERLAAHLLSHGRDG